MFTFVQRFKTDDKLKGSKGVTVGEHAINLGFSGDDPNDTSMGPPILEFQRKDRSTNLLATDSHQFQVDDKVSKIVELIDDSSSAKNSPVNPASLSTNNLFQRQQQPVVDHGDSDIVPRNNHVLTASEKVQRQRSNDDYFDKRKLTTTSSLVAEVGLDDQDQSDFEELECMSQMHRDSGGVIPQGHDIKATPNGITLPRDEPPAFGDVTVKHSSNVHLGNKTFYKGPVTIKQIVYSNPDNDPGVIKNLTKEGGLSNPNLHTTWRTVKGLRQIGSLKCAVFCCILTLFVVTAVIMSAVILSRGSNEPRFPEIPDSGLDGVNVTNVRFVSRIEWGAQPPTEPLAELKLPVPYVIVSHTATDVCSTQSQCTFIVRFCQTFHIESRNWSDVGYNYMVGGDGLAYVGRGWKFWPAQAIGYNDKSISISFLGTFNSVVPPKRQLQAAQKLIEVGVKGGAIAKDYKLIAHRQVSPTLSPGDALYTVIKTWPHWTDLNAPNTTTTTQAPV